MCVYPAFPGPAPGPGEPMRTQPGLIAGRCHGGVQALLLLPAAPAPGRCLPAAAGAGSSAHTLAGASAVGWLRGPSSGSGLGQQVRDGVRSPCSPNFLSGQPGCVHLPGCESRRAGLLTISTPDLHSQLSLSGSEFPLLRPYPCLTASCSLLLPAAVFGAPFLWP